MRSHTAEGSAKMYTPERLVKMSMIGRASFLLAILLLNAIGVFATAKKLEDIQTIAISIKVEQQPSLFILLSADGTINRLGTGTVDNKEKTLIIDMTKDGYFQKLRSKVNPSWFRNLGVYDIPGKMGKKVELVIFFVFNDGSEGNLKFLYGSESQGPPQEIGQFIYAAVDLTNPWYESWKAKRKAH